MWVYLAGSPVINRGDIDKLEVHTRHIKEALIDQDRTNESLRTDIARLLLVVETLRRALISRGVLTQQEFEELLKEVDLEDGVPDGLRTRRKVPRKKCPHCGRLNRNRAYCYVCGQPLLSKEKVRTGKKLCRKCDQPNIWHATKCIYCGTPFGVTKTKAASKPHGQKPKATVLR